MAPRQAAHTADVNRPEFAGVLWSVGLYSGGVCRQTQESLWQFGVGTNIVLYELFLTKCTHSTL